MAYNSQWLSLVANMGTDANFKQWLYVTTDNNAAVTAAGYITDAATRGMQVGDIVIVQTVTTLPRTTPVDCGLYMVSAINSSGAATLLAGVAVS